MLSRPHPLTPARCDRTRIYPTSTLQIPNSGKPEFGREEAFPLAYRRDCELQIRDTGSHAAFSRPSIFSAACTFGRAATRCLKAIRFFMGAAQVSITNI